MYSRYTVSAVQPSKGGDDRDTMEGNGSCPPLIIHFEGLTARLFVRFLTIRTKPYRHFGLGKYPAPRQSD